MKQYIDKSALVAEIEKLQLCTMDEHMNFYSAETQGEYNALSRLESFIDTLEVKEVDLEKELSYEDYKSFFEKYPDLSDDWGFEEAWTFAQYFFELGLKAQKGE